MTITTACCRLNAWATQEVGKSSLLWQTLESRYTGLIVAIARSFYQTQVIVYVTFDLMYIQSCLLSVLVGLGWHLHQTNRNWIGVNLRAPSMSAQSRRAQQYCHRSGSIRFKSRRSRMLGKVKTTFARTTNSKANRTFDSTPNSQPTGQH
jgi:hypothetical protein